jgi:C-terminal processing protease CtpA/Prc
MMSRITVAALTAGAFAGLALPADGQQSGEGSARAQAQAQARSERERERELAAAQARAEQAQADRERAQADRERAQEDRERAQEDRERMRAELERARAELEEAARKVARLSAEFTAPAVREVMKNVGMARQRAMIGIGTEDDASGVRVTAVSPNGPAAAAGLQRGDVIVAIDGAALPAAAGGQSPTAALVAQMENLEPGETVSLEVRAPDGSYRTVAVQTRALGQAYWWPENFDFDFDFEPPNVRINPFNAWFGGAQQAWRSMELVQLTPELGSYFGTERGVLVVRGPNREGFGLRDGDVIIDIGGREPASPEHAMRILGSFEPGETLRMTVMRQQRRETLEVQIPQPERPERAIRQPERPNGRP